MSEANPNRYWSARRIASALGLTAAVLALGAGVGWWRSRPLPLHGERVRTTAMPSDLDPTPPMGRADNDRSAPRQAEPPFDFENLTVERDMIESGGVPKDGIPALTDAAMVDANAANEQLQDDDRVIGVEIDGEPRAYPVKVLISHEIVNDTLGATPLAVVYCPLCDSATVVDRRLGARTIEFGVSGLLMNSNVLMYDRGTDGLWSQLEFEAISGPDAGAALTHLPWTITTWSRWRSDHPGTSVLSTKTGHRASYDRHPYGDYFETDRLMFPVAAEDDRLPRKTRVIGVVVDGAAHAFPYVAGDMIQTTIGDATLTIEADGEGVRIIEAPAGAQIAHTYWFAWYAAHPETTLAAE